MNLLFIHQNAPGQFRYIAPHLAARGHRVALLGQRDDQTPVGVGAVKYAAPNWTLDELPRTVAGVTAQFGNALAVREALTPLAASATKPDLIIGHAGWGELGLVKAIFPEVPLLGYFEFCYRSPQGIVGFDPSLPVSADANARARFFDVSDLMAFEDCDWGLTATDWQKSLYPPHRAARLSVLHEGVDTASFCPDPDARLVLPDGHEFRAGEEIVTYAARGFEPIRGFPTFLRALPALLSARPQLQVLIAGEDHPAYGPPAEGGKSWRTAIWDEIKTRVDPNRIHFLGWLKRDDLRRFYQISAAHVYLSYPFVVSWSLFEAMACGAAIVGSDTGPVRELVTPDQTGLLVDFFSADQLARAVLGLLSDGDRRRRLGAAARALMVARYDFSTVIAPRYEALIDDLINLRPPTT